MNGDFYGIRKTYKQILSEISGRVESHETDIGNHNNILEEHAENQQQIRENVVVQGEQIGEIIDNVNGINRRQDQQEIEIIQQHQNRLTVALAQTL